MDDRSKRVLIVLHSDALIEQLAAIEHDRWSHWQSYLHEQCSRDDDGRLIIPAHLVERWSRQLLTPYVELSEEVKASDREQVMRYLPAIESALRQALASNRDK